MIAKVFPYVILFLWGCAFPACASDEILSGLSENKISITTSFTGSELLVFGYCPGALWPYGLSLVKF